MSDTKTEEEPKRKEPAKKGLHGWKAATAVFGCGTLAAFGVFGVIVGVFSMLISTASSGFSSPEEEAIIGAQPAQPREELEPGGMNLCDDYLAHVSDITIEEAIGSTHSDDAMESSYDSEVGRVVSGECQFMVDPHYGTTSRWSFEFRFDAVIYDPEMNRDQIASKEFEAKVSGAGSEFKSLDNQKFHNWSEEAQSFYGTDDSGTSQYLVVAQTRSATYELLFKGDPAGAEAGEVPEFDFERQAEDLVKRLEGRLSRVIPS